jgi:hypothetical protein
VCRFRHKHRERLPEKFVRCIPEDVLNDRISKENFAFVIDLDDAVAGGFGYDAVAFLAFLEGVFRLLPVRDYFAKYDDPRWTPENRPVVGTSKPASGPHPEQLGFTPRVLGPASFS